MTLALYPLTATVKGSAGVRRLKLHASTVSFSGEKSTGTVIIQKIIPVFYQLYIEKGALIQGIIAIKPYFFSGS